MVPVVGNSELIFYNSISTPVAVRDMVCHVYAADCSEERGCIAFMGKSINSYEDVEVPPEPSIFSGYRTDVKYLCGVVNIISPTTAKVSIIRSDVFDFNVYPLFRN